MSEDTECVLSSFGFKYGLPEDADFVIDVRCLANPYWVEEMKDKCGLDDDVADYVFASDEAREYIKAAADMLIGFIAMTDKPRVRVYIGCTGGQHRSVAFTERLHARLCSAGIKCNRVHRELGRN